MIALGLDNCGLVNITVYYPGCPGKRQSIEVCSQSTTIVLFDVWIVTVYRNSSAYLLLFSFDVFAVSKGMPVPRNIIAGLKIAPRRTLRWNIFAGGKHIPGENPLGGENYVAPLQIKSPPVTIEQLQHHKNEQVECRFNKSQNLDMQNRKHNANECQRATMTRYALPRWDPQ